MNFLANFLKQKGVVVVLSVFFSLRQLVCRRIGVPLLGPVDAFQDA